MPTMSQPKDWIRKIESILDVIFDLIIYLAIIISIVKMIYMVVTIQHQSILDTITVLIVTIVLTALMLFIKIPSKAKD